MGSIVDFPIQNCYENRDEDEIQEYWNKVCEERFDSKLDIEVVVVDSKVSNNTYITGQIGVLQKVTFKSIEQVDKFEKQECGNRNSYNSWTSCENKFKQFPCVIYCRFTKKGYDEEYVAQYITKEEYRADLLKSLEEAM